MPHLTTRSDPSNPATFGGCSSRSKKVKAVCESLQLNPALQEERSVFHIFSEGKRVHTYRRRWTIRALRLFLEDPSGTAAWMDEPSGTNITFLDDQAFTAGSPNMGATMALVYLYTSRCTACLRQRRDVGTVASVVRDYITLGGSNDSTSRRVINVAAIDIDSPASVQWRDKAKKYVLFYFHATICWCSILHGAQFYSGVGARYVHGVRDNDIRNRVAVDVDSDLAGTEVFRSMRNTYHLKTVVLCVRFDYFFSGG